MNKRKTAQAMFQPGDRVTVTNYYITRPDHPCYGTRTAEVVRSTTAGLTLEPGGHTPWPNADSIVINGTGWLQLYGHPEPGALFLDIRKVVPHSAAMSKQIAEASARFGIGGSGRRQP